jgi:hypothetical protein
VHYNKTLTPYIYIYIYIYIIPSSALLSSSVFATVSGCRSAGRRLAGQGSSPSIGPGDDVVRAYNRNKGVAVPVPAHGTGGQRLLSLLLPFQSDLVFLSILQRLAFA